MTGTRYPDMICLSMVDSEYRAKMKAGHRNGGRPGAPVRNELPTLPPERPVVVLEYSDRDIGLMVRMACGLDGPRSTAWEIGEELGEDEPMKIGRFLDTIKMRLNGRQSGNHGRPRPRGRPCGMTAEQKVRAGELCDGGMAMTEIAEAVGATLGQVRHVLSKT